MEGLNWRGLRSLRTDVLGRGDSVDWPVLMQLRDAAPAAGDFAQRPAALSLPCEHAAHAAEGSWPMRWTCWTHAASSTRAAPDRGLRA
jgi:hypothetical protein